MDYRDDGIWNVWLVPVEPDKHFPSNDVQIMAVASAPVQCAGASILKSNRRKASSVESIRFLSPFNKCIPPIKA
jgi:hypothetical protein